jgi:hypothetical protein
MLLEDDCWRWSPTEGPTMPATVVATRGAAKQRSGSARQAQVKAFGCLRESYIWVPPQQQAAAQDAERQAAAQGPAQPQVVPAAYVHSSGTTLSRAAVSPLC